MLSGLVCGFGRRAFGVVGRLASGQPLRGSSSSATDDVARVQQFGYEDGRADMNIVSFKVVSGIATAVRAAVRRDASMTIAHRGQCVGRRVADGVDTQVGSNVVSTRRALLRFVFLAPGAEMGEVGGSGLFQWGASCGKCWCATDHN